MGEHSRLKVLLVSSEVAPFAKTGGLADVAGSLPQALIELGLDVRVVMPKYKFIGYPMETRFDFPVTVGGRKEAAVIRESYLDAGTGGGQKVPVYFVDNYQYFDRDSLYCFFDEAERFAFFCRAVIEMLPGLDFKPDVIHCNDWQTGPIAVLLNEQYRIVPFYRDIATVFTVHNLFYQGNYPADCLRVLGLGEEYFHPDRLEFYGNVSFIKAGLAYADIINTVSRTYAREIQTAEYGEKMDGLLRTRSADLYGIINGIDYREFDPAHDKSIKTNFDRNSVNKKKDNKRALQEALGLPSRDVPLLALVSRLVDQKGLDLLEEIFADLLREDVQVVLLGSGDRRYEEFFKEAALKDPERVAAHIGFNAPLAQLMYAGADIFLMPSRFEPCGLSQMISLRYGTIPIVRATGGLADTVDEFIPDKGGGNGFVFTEYKAEAFLDTIRRAVKVYRDRPTTWEKLLRQAMECDYSWAVSAKEYVKLYELAVKKKTAGK